MISNSKYTCGKACSNEIIELTELFYLTTERMCIKDDFMLEYVQCIPSTYSDIKEGSTAINAIQNSLECTPKEAESVFGSLLNDAKMQVELFHRHMQASHSTPENKKLGIRRKYTSLNRTVDSKHQNLDTFLNTLAPGCVKVDYKAVIQEVSEVEKNCCVYSEDDKKLITQITGLYIKQPDRLQEIFKKYSSPANGITVPLAELLKVTNELVDGEAQNGLDGVKGAAEEEGAAPTGEVSSDEDYEEDGGW